MTINLLNNWSTCNSDREAIQYVFEDVVRDFAGQKRTVLLKELAKLRLVNDTLSVLLNQHCQQANDVDECSVCHRKTNHEGVPYGDFLVKV